MDRHVASSDQGIRAVLEVIRRWSSRIRRRVERRNDDEGAARTARLPDRGRGGNTARAIDAIRSHPDVDIAVFPELYLCGYTYRDLDELARPIDSDEIAEIAAAAAEAETAVVIGFAERMSQGVANSAACIDNDGSVAGVYRKTHLFGSEADSRVRRGRGAADRRARRPASSPTHLLRHRVPRARPAGRARRRRPPRHRLREHGSVLHRPRRRRRRAGPREPPPAPLRQSRRQWRRARLRRRQQVDRPHRRVLVEASRDQEELLVVPVAELGGFDPRTDYPKFVRPPRPVTVIEKEHVTR